MPKQLSKMFYTNDAAYLEKLQSSYDAIRAEFSEDSIYLAKKLYPKFTLAFNTPLPVSASMAHAVSLSDLFAVMCFCPTFPAKISFQINDKHYPDGLSIFPAQYFNRRTIDLIDREKNHVLMAIRLPKIDLGRTIEKWLTLENLPDTLLSQIQHDTGFWTKHELHGEIIVSAATLEGLSYLEGQTVEKYKYAIERYSSSEIYRTLRQIFKSCGEDDIGIAISDLRNEMVHLGRQRRLLNQLSLIDLSLIASLLRMVVLGVRAEQFRDYGSGHTRLSKLSWTGKISAAMNSDVI